MGILTLLLAIGAVVRLTRMVTDDYLFETPRTWVLMKLHPDGQLSYLVKCRWCASVWVSVPVMGAWIVWGGVPAFTAVCAALTASYAAGFLAVRERPGTEEEGEQ
jgi:hypothetical protein